MIKIYPTFTSIGSTIFRIDLHHSYEISFIAIAERTFKESRLANNGRFFYLGKK